MDPKVMKWKLLNYSLVSQLHLVPQTQFVGLACKVVYIRLLSWESAQNLIFFSFSFNSCSNAYIPKPKENIILELQIIKRTFSGLLFQI